MMLTIGMFLEIQTDSFEKGILTQKRCHHTEYCAAFAVADGIKNLVDIEGVLDRHMDGMTGSQ